MSTRRSKEPRSRRPNALQVEQIRTAVRQGIEEIERGESKDYEGEKGLKQLVSEIRTPGLKELAAERRKRAKR